MASWNKNKRAQEEDFFAREEREALKKLSGKKEAKPVLQSPVSSMPMITKEVYGVKIEECPESGGMWLNKGDLEAIIEAASKHHSR